jgi:hypothetical protein
MSQRLQELTERTVDAILNFQEIREEISKEFGQAKTAEYRAALLAMLKSTEDIVETTIAPENLEEFKRIRLLGYKTFIVQEALVGEHVCAETLDEVTRREIAAGRMDPSDELRQIALKGMAAPYLSRAELLEIDEKKRAADTLAATPPVSGWRRALAWIRRS